MLVEENVPVVMLEDRTAIVTGATNSIGRAIALELAAYGADVVVADIEREPRNGNAPTDELVSEAGQRGEFVRTDVSDPNDVRELMETVRNTFGGLDILVNNAAVFKDGGIDDLELDYWRGMIAVNLTGTFLCCKLALPMLLEGENGSIVNISSVAGLHASSNSAAYCASKAGVTNLTRQIALDFAGDGIRSNSVHPGLIDASSTRGFQETEKGRKIIEGNPSGRLGTPEEVAGVVVFLASDLASYVNGHALVVDGALTTKYY